MELWQTVSKMLKILLTFWLWSKANLDKAWGKNYMNCSSGFCWLTKGGTWRMSNVCWWEWWNSRKYARRGRAACKYNELEWKVESLCWSACIYEHKKLAPHLHRQSSAVFAFPGCGKRGKIAWKAKGEPKTTGDNGRVSALFCSFPHFCASAWKLHNSSKVCLLAGLRPDVWHLNLCT